MENRFGVKDVIMLLLLVALLLSVWLAMKQYDRQWEELRAIREQVEGQAHDLRTMREALKSGVAVVGSASRPATTPTVEKDDPFSRLRAAMNLPGYARGGWLIDAFGNTVGKLTPLVSSDAYASTVQGYVLESLATRDPDTLDWKPLLATAWTVQDNTAQWDAAVNALRQQIEKNPSAWLASRKGVPADLKAQVEKLIKKEIPSLTDSDLAVEPSLPPAMSIKFTMRPNLRFSDGEPLTADDVVFSFNFVMDPAINSPRDKAYYSRIRQVEKTGDDEVTFTFREPYFEAFGLAASMSIFPKHFYSKFKPAEFNDSVGLLMGSGPYMLENPTSWKPGTLIQLVRNERYWGPQAAFDRFVWREITNDAAHLAAFRNGDIDLFPAFPEQYQGMIADQGLLGRTQHFEYQSPLGGYRYIAWNEIRKGQPTRFADKRVRQAMTMLLDRNRMIQEIMLGYAELATGPFSPLSKQCDPTVQPWPYDVKRAQDLLAQAGFKDRNGDGVIDDAEGKPFEFKLTYPSGSGNYDKMVLFMKDAYAEAGILLKPDPLDWAVMIEKLNKKDFDAISLGWTAGIENDIFQMFHSSQMVADGDDCMSYKNAELDGIIEKARRTIDEDTRIPMWRATHRILHEDQPYTFLFYAKSLVFLDKNVHNAVITKRLGLNDRTEWFVPVGQQRQAQ